MYTKIIGYILKGKASHLPLIYKEFSSLQGILKILDSL